MQIKLIEPRGFCFGVRRAISLVEEALEKNLEKKVYVLHSIVHNEKVIEDLELKGAIFIEDLKEAKEGNVLIISAHGISPKLRNEIQNKDFKIIDATCPLVEKVHKEAIKFSKLGYEILLIGHPGHREVLGIMGEAPMHLISSVDDIENLALNIRDKANSKIACLSQTTFSVEKARKIFQAIKEKYSNLVTMADKDICHATQVRQDALRKACDWADLVLVVGSENSNNTRELLNLALDLGIESYLISSKKNLDKNIFLKKEKVAITAGASTPEYVVEEVVGEIEKLNFQRI